MKNKAYYNFNIIKKYIVAIATILQDFKVEHSTNTWTATGGTTSTLVDTTNLQDTQQDDYYNGYVIRHLTGTNAPQVLPVTDYDTSTGELTFNTANAIGADDTYRLVKQITVPITFTEKNKLSYILQRKSIEAGGEKISTTLPRIGYLLSGIVPDSSRMVNRLNRVTANLTNGTQDVQYAALPFNYTFDVSIWTKNNDDMLQLLEQILPIFSPDITLTVNEIPSLGMTSDVPIVLNGASKISENDYDETTSRILQWDLGFTLMGYLYPNIATEGVIETVIVNLKDLDETDRIYRTITLTE